ERLVAVIASGRTVEARQRSIGALLDQHIPVIASRLTGDNLVPQGPTSPSVQGLARPAPTDSDQVAAALAYLAATTKNALLVQNTDPDDVYSRSLGDAFRNLFRGKLLLPVETYNPKLGGVANTMKSMLINICEQRPDVIFFAGRGA